MIKGDSMNRFSSVTIAGISAKKIHVYFACCISSFLIRKEKVNGMHLLTSKSLGMLHK